MDMSFVTAAPDLVEAAAQDLAGIRSSLMEASASVAAPTTGVVPAAADEVSAGVAALFGNFGKEFQAVSAQAQAFHAEFVNAMNAGAAAYVSTEAANAGQALLGAVAAPAQALLGGGAALTTGQATPALIQGIESFGATVAAPYQALVINTNNNLAAINQTFMANPFPFLNQVASNQIGFTQTFGAGLATSLQGFPANVPANIQLAIQGAMTFNPAALAQGFITQQQGYAQTISSSLQLAAQEFATGAQTLPPAFQAAFQQLLAGNNIGAYETINSALINAFLPGFNATQVPGGTIFGNFLVTPMGPLGALGPIFTIPGQMAQSFTNLLPPGSILEQMAQNGTNVVDALTNFNTELDVLSLTTANLSFGAPVQLIFGLLGAPGNALSALNSTGVAFAGAVQAGNASAAAAAILDAPAFMANGFLNGTTVVTLPPTDLTILGLPTVSTVSLPLGGLLTPLSFPSAVANVEDGALILPVDIVGGTPVGGLIPAMLSVDSQLAQAITPIT
jgi:PE family